MDLDLPRAANLTFPTHVQRSLNTSLEAQYNSYLALSSPDWVTVICPAVRQVRARRSSHFEHGTVKRKMAPRGAFASATREPPCASMIDRQMESPMPRPLVLVV